MYIVLTDAWHSRLKCKSCGRFYGFIAKQDDVGFYLTIQEEFGVIDMDAVKWPVTDYQDRTVSNESFEPTAEDQQCVSCEIEYVGSTCPRCGEKRNVRRVSTKKRRFKRRKKRKAVSDAKGSPYIAANNG